MTPCRISRLLQLRYGLVPAFAILMLLASCSKHEAAPLNPDSTVVPPLKVLNIKRGYVSWTNGSDVNSSIRGWLKISVYPNYLMVEKLQDMYGKKEADFIIPRERLIYAGDKYRGVK